MQMQLRDLVLFAHDAFRGRISGRTALQKIVYFLSVILEEDAGYNPHYYGPYSPKVAEANSELKELNYINEKSSVYGYTSQGFEMIKYDYCLTPDGLNLLERKKKLHSSEWESVSKIADKILKAGNMDYMELAMAAKAYIIIDREGGKADKAVIKSKAKQLGWSISDAGLDNALTFLEKIELVNWN
jgi:uncharacterized protein